MVRNLVRVNLPNSSVPSLIIANSGYLKTPVRDAKTGRMRYCKKRRSRKYGGNKGELRRSAKKDYSKSRKKARKSSRKRQVQTRRCSKTRLDYQVGECATVNSRKRVPRKRVRVNASLPVSLPVRENANTENSKTQLDYQAGECVTVN